MKFAVIVAIIISVFAGGIFVANKNSSVTDESVTTNQLAQGTVVYDVRTPEEYAGGHAEGAINLPLDKIQSGVYPQAAKTSPIAVYCHSGNRSGQATTILKQAGYTNITDIGAYGNLKSYGL